MPPTPPVAILAGGLATRLGELTRSVPKSLLDVAGRPFLAWQLELLARQGFRDIVLCVGHHGKQIEAAFGDGEHHGVRLRYSWDPDEPLGTGGALQHALALLGDEFIVMYGDSFLPCHFGAVVDHFRLAREDAGSTRPLGLMTVYQNEDRYDTSNVQFEHGRILRHDKVEKTPDMRHIDWGLAVLRAEAFDGRAPGSKFDLMTLYQDLIAKNAMVGLEMRQRFYEIGSVSGLEELRKHAQAGTLPEIHSA